MNPKLARFTVFVDRLTRETDGSLLEAFRDGNQSAFRELVDRHGSLVFGVCNRILRHQQDAEDAFQAAFIVLARRAADVWPRDAIGSWLYGVATRVALKARTLRIRRQKREELLTSHFEKRLIEPEKESVDLDTADAIDRVVKKLPEVYRAALVACDLQGLSRKDAARRLGWTEGTLSGRLARARKLLVARLNKAGITYPALGLAAALGTDVAVRAGMSNLAMRVVSSSSGIPDSLVALTQGVAQNVFAFKLKSSVGALLVACALGFGAWTAGAGDDPTINKDAKGKVSPPMALSKEQGLDLSKIRAELNAIQQELIDLLVENKAAGGNPPESVKRRIHQAEEKLAEFRKLMSEARQQTIPHPTEPIAILDPALEDLEGKWKIESIKDGKTVQPVDPKVEFVVEIAGNKLFMPYRESDGTVKRNEYKITVDASKNPKWIALSQPSKPVGSGIYELTAASTTCIICHANTQDLKQPLGNALVSCNPGGKYATGLRLAVAMNGPRPTQFGGTEGMLEFHLTRIGGLQAGWAAEKLIDSYFLKEEMLRFRQAQTNEEQARASLAHAKADLAQALAKVEESTRTLEILRARVAALEKLTSPVKPSPQVPVKDVAAYSIYIRTQFAPEKVVRVKATGAQTVLEGLAYAAEDMAIKPEAISVWVVREKEMLSVDLAAITQNGETKTNYQLKPGDKLFVQVKIGK